MTIHPISELIKTAGWGPFVWTIKVKKTESILEQNGVIRIQASKMEGEVGYGGTGFDTFCTLRMWIILKLHHSQAHKVF